MRNRPLSSPSPVAPASREQVDKFLKGLQEFQAKGDNPIDEAGVKAYLDKMTVGSQQGIARRIMMDIMKAPTRELLKGKDERKRKPTKKKSKQKKTSPKARAKPKTKSSPVKKKKASRRR
jgi:hypothetical protein